LISAALVPEYEDVVRKAVEGAGKRNFIMGGAEIVALAGIALTALNLIITKGMASRKVTITEKDEKGNVTKITEEVVTYQVSPKLGSILQNFFGHLVSPKNGAK